MKILAVFCGITLLLGIPSGWDYSYYTLLRWFICFSGAYIAYGFYKSNLQTWTFIFGTIAFLFNPIFPVYLNKDTWVIIDLIAAIIFFLAAYSHKEKSVD